MIEHIFVVETPQGEQGNLKSAAGHLPRTGALLGQAVAPRLLIPLYIQPGEEVKSLPVWHFPSRYPGNTSQYLSGSAALLGDVGVGSHEALAPYGLGRNAKARVFPVLVPKQPC